MQSYPKIIKKFLISLIIIFLCLYSSKYLLLYFNVNFPASILGMLMLFALLQTGLLKVEKIKPAASLFNKHMALMFVPIGVASLLYLEQLAENLFAIIVICLISTLMVLIAIAMLFEKMSENS